MTGLDLSHTPLRYTSDFIRISSTIRDEGTFFDTPSAKASDPGPTRRAPAWKVGVANVPYTWPVWEVNGWMVSGFPTPSRRDYAFGVDASDWPIEELWNRDAVFAGGASDYMMLFDLERRICDMVKRFPTPDLLFLGFISPDRVAHRYIDDEDIMLKAYVHCDDILAQFVNLKEDLVLVFSDHGAAPIDECIEYKCTHHYMAAKRAGLVGGHTMDALFMHYPRIIPPVAVPRHIREICPLIKSHLSGGIFGPDLQKVGDRGILRVGSEENEHLSNTRSTLPDDGQTEVYSQEEEELIASKLKALGYLE